MAIELSRPRWGLRRRPFRELSRMEREMEDMFSRFFGGWPWPRMDVEPFGSAPSVDMVDRRDEVILRADLPGLSEKDIQLTLEEGALTIRGERKEEREKEEEDYYCCERWSGSFSRSLMLPPGIKTEKVSATFRNGVLEIHLPKTKEAEARKIEVKAA